MSASALTNLPRVSRVFPLGGKSIRLELETGEALELTEGVRAALFPFPDAEGLHVLSYEWGRPSEAAYAAPAELLPELLPYFPEGQS